MDLVVMLTKREEDLPAKLRARPAPSEEALEKSRLALEDAYRWFTNASEKHQLPNRSEEAVALIVGALKAHAALSSSAPVSEAKPCVKCDGSGYVTVTDGLVIVSDRRCLCVPAPQSSGKEGERG